jgi:hypothetical protein
VDEEIEGPVEAFDAEDEDDYSDAVGLARKTEKDTCECAPT